MACPIRPVSMRDVRFVWLATIVYLFSIWRRLNKVEHEMRALAQKAPHR